VKDLDPRAVLEPSGSKHLTAHKDQPAAIPLGVVFDLRKIETAIDFP
jgi:hypothetical protein